MKYIFTTTLMCLLFLYAGLANATGAGASSQETIFTQSPPVVVWNTKKQKPRAVILCIHGLGLHRLTYGDFAKEMEKRGIICFAIDLRGFGIWQKSDKTVDFERSLADVTETLEKIRQTYKDTPVFLLGESMGGAVALQAAAQHPEVQGLISSVPSGERFKAVDQELGVALHALTSGFNAPMDVGSTVIRKSTAKQDLRATWSNDPLGRNQFSPNELISFQHFMADNLKAAKKITTMPVLVFQGVQDKLVRPTGTWDVYDHLSTPNSQIVFSRTAEHLIFEYNQFSQDDLNYLTAWIDKNSISKKEERPRPQDPPTNPNALSVGYWIELKRDGQVYRCNNKTSFESGDEIRFHLQSSHDGYAYIVLEAGSSGAHAILFPDQTTGRNNYIIKDKDVALPTRTWLKFDNRPGTEVVRVIVSKTPIDEVIERNPEELGVTAFISSDKSGAKDLVPTRMKLAWDDPNPVIMTESTNVGLAQVKPANLFTSLVKVTQENPEKAIGLEISLDHR